MCDITLSELLVLFMLIASSARVLYIKQARIDALASLPQIAFVISLLNIYIWGFSALEIWICIVAFYAFVLNVPSALKVSSYLYVDYYHPVFSFFSVFAMLLSIVTAATVLLFAPVRIKNTGIKVSEYKYAGKCSTGFTRTTSKYEKADAVLTVFEPKDGSTDFVTFRTDEGSEISGNFENGKPILVFLGDKRASTDMYRPYLEKLAVDGYTVIAGEFFASDMKWITATPDTAHFRRFAINMADLSGNWDVVSQKANFEARCAKEYTMLLYLAGEFNEGRKPFFLIGDEMCSDALSLSAVLYSSAVCGYFDMSAMEVYPAGYGCIEQTDPLLAYLHGRRRDREQKIPRLLAARTEEAVILSSKIAISSKVLPSEKKYK